MKSKLHKYIIKKRNEQYFREPPPRNRINSYIKAVKNGTEKQYHDERGHFTKHKLERCP